MIVDELISINPVERAKRPRHRRRARHRLDRGPAPGLPRHAASTAWVPSSTSPPTPEPAGANCSTSAGQMSTWRQRDHHHRVDRRDRRRAHRRHHQERPDPRRVHRRRHRRRAAPAQGRPGRRPAQGGRLLARRQRRLRVHDRLGRTHLPRHRDLADDQAHPRPQRAEQGLPKASRTPGCTTCATSTPRPCCCRASRSTSSPPAWATPTRPSPSGSTPTSSAPPKPPPRTSSPRP